LVIIIAVEVMIRGWASCLGLKSYDLARLIALAERIGLDPFEPICNNSRHFFFKVEITCH